MQRERVAWIDIAKGLGLLLVVLGHTVGGTVAGSVARGVIFSFHMPLYFVLSSLTFRCSASPEEFRRKTKKAARHLLLPLLIAAGIGALWELLGHPGRLLSAGWWRDKALMLTVASGVWERFAGVDIPALGIPWFFAALFVGRGLYDLMHLRTPQRLHWPLAAAVSSAGAWLGARLGFLPFSLDIALAVFLFFQLGQTLQRLDWTRRPGLTAAVSGAVWLGTLYLTFPNPAEWTYMELAVRRYTLWPLCCLCAAAGVICFAELCVLLSRRPRLSWPLRRIGEDALIFLVIHALDYIAAFAWQHGPEFTASGLRILWNAAVFALVLFLRTLWRKRKARQTAA